MRNILTTVLIAGAVFGGAAYAADLKACREADFTSRPAEVSERELERHRLSDIPSIVYPHGQFTGGYDFTVAMVIDASGKPDCQLPLQVHQQLNAQRRAVIGALADMRFKPFVRNGQPVTALVYLPIIEEEAVAQARPIPDARPEDTRIILDRSPCFGACPTYEVTISGTGRVHYSGGVDVLMEDEFAYDISPEAVAQIMTAFETAQFWALKDEYAADITDLPTTTVVLERGGKTKKLTDYAGARIGMPRAATALEETIDRLSGVRDLTRGGETMLPLLDRLNFDFGGKKATDLMASQVREGSLELIGGFFDRGVMPEAALESAAFFGRSDVFGLARSRGAAVDPDMRCALQLSTAATGDFAFFMEVTGADGDICRKDTILLDLSDQRFYGVFDGETGLTCNRSTTWCFRQEMVKVLKYLLAHGANMYAVNQYGRMPIDSAYEEEEVRAYLEAGYDIDHRDAKGNTALMRSDFTDRSMILLRLGADPFIRNKAGKDYYTLARKIGGREMVKYIDAHRSRYRNAPKR